MVDDEVIRLKKKLEIMQRKVRGRKSFKKKSVSDMRENIKSSNIHVIGVPGRKERVNAQNKIFS